MDNINELTVERAKNGDSAAFAELYSVFAQDLFRFACYYVGNSHDAEDAVQNAVLSAYRRLPSLRKNSSFKSWLFKILSNCCRDLLEKRSKTQDYIPLFEANAADIADASEKNAVEMYAMLEQLPEIDRNIILLSVVGGYTSAEIAKMTDMKPGSVRSRQARALEKLRAALG